MWFGFFGFLTFIVTMSIFSRKDGPDGWMWSLSVHKGPQHCTSLNMRTCELCEVAAVERNVLHQKHISGFCQSQGLHLHFLSKKTAAQFFLLFYYFKSFFPFFRSEKQTSLRGKYEETKVSHIHPLIPGNVLKKMKGFIGNLNYVNAIFIWMKIIVQRTWL